MSRFEPWSILLIHLLFVSTTGIVLYDAIQSYVNDLPLPSNDATKPNLDERPMAWWMYIIIFEFCMVIRYVFIILPTHDSGGLDGRAFMLFMFFWVMVFAAIFSYPIYASLAICCLLQFFNWRASTKQS
jgi:hypothetical protein